MAKYIDREAAIKMMRGSAISKYPLYFSIGILAAADELQKMTAADVAPVVHGRWDEWYPPMHMILTGEEMLYRCSSCDAKYSDVEGFRFCPNCGARMDLEVSDGKSKNDRLFQASQTE